VNCILIAGLIEMREGDLVKIRREDA
jgi:hypothetical protein